MPDRATLVAFVAFVISAASISLPSASRTENWPRCSEPGCGFRLPLILLAVAFVLRRQSLPRGGASLAVLLYGLLIFTLAYGFAYWALTRLPAGIGSVIFASMPLFMVFLARWHSLEPFRMRGLVGALMTLVGIAVLGDPFGRIGSLGAAAGDAGLGGGRGRRQRREQVLPTGAAAGRQCGRDGPRRRSAPGVVCCVR